MAMRVAMTVAMRKAMAMRVAMTVAMAFGLEARGNGVAAQHVLSRELSFVDSSLSRFLGPFFWRTLHFADSQHLSSCGI